MSDLPSTRRVVAKLHKHLRFAVTWRRVSGVHASVEAIAKRHSWTVAWNHTKQSESKQKPGEVRTGLYESINLDLQSLRKLGLSARQYFTQQHSVTSTVNSGVSLRMLVTLQRAHEIS